MEHACPPTPPTRGTPPDIPMKGPQSAQCGVRTRWHQTPEPGCSLASYVCHAMCLHLCHHITAKSKWNILGEMQADMCKCGACLLAYTSKPAGMPMAWQKCGAGLRVLKACTHESAEHVAGSSKQPVYRCTVCKDASRGTASSKMYMEFTLRMHHQPCCMHVRHGGPCAASSEPAKSILTGFPCWAPTVFVEVDAVRQLASAAVFIRPQTVRQHLHAQHDDADAWRPTCGMHGLRVSRNCQRNIIVGHIATCKGITVHYSISQHAGTCTDSDA